MQILFVIYTTNLTIAIATLQSEVQDVTTAQYHRKLLLLSTYIYIDIPIVFTIVIVIVIAVAIALGTEEFYKSRQQPRSLLSSLAIAVAIDVAIALAVAATNDFLAPDHDHQAVISTIAIVVTK